MIETLTYLLNEIFYNIDKELTKVKKLILYIVSLIRFNVFELFIYKMKHKFSHEEDILLTNLVEKYGTSNWKLIADRMKGRTNRQCRERWKYYLSPNLKHESWSNNEEKLLLEKVNEYGTKWSLISKYFPNRTDVDIKNRYKKINRSINKNNNSENSNQSIKKSNRVFIEIPVPISLLLHYCQ